MNALYKKLTKFGSLVYSKSKSKKTDISRYFTVLLPGHPIIKNSDRENPELEFNEACPPAVKNEVAELWQKVFGKAS
jgi:hypothetical protein